MKYETVIGLEVHVELSTKTKIFCGCSTEFGGEPNSHTCPVCVGMPGTLPVLNKEVVEKGLRAALALNCKVTETNIFDRKNYFYPDLAKDYQISQLYEPLCRDGYVDIDMGDYKRRIRIHEIHMEEDAGKLIHDAGASYVDYNRGGVPLIEIVSEPDLRSAEEVSVYLEKLKEILTYLDVSDCKMEEGSMRADVNISIREEGSDEYGTRSETKNMNSIKAIQRAIEYESARQIAIVESGNKVIQETRRWDDNTGEGSAMRSKENAQDYRYFPDPDLIPVYIDEAWVQRSIESSPELAEEKRSRYISDWNISKNIAAVLTSDKLYANMFENVVASIMQSMSETGDKKDLAPLAREAANTVTGDVMYLLKENEVEKVNEQNLATVIMMIKEGKINRTSGKEVIEKVVLEDADPEKYVKDNNLELVDDTDLVEKTVDKVIAQNPESVADYIGGKEKAFGFLVGQSMKELKGKASPQIINSLLKEKIEAAGGKVSLSDKATGTEHVEEAVEGKLKATEKLEPILENAEEETTEDEKENVQFSPEIPAWRKKMNDIQSGNQGQDICNTKDSVEETRVFESGRYRTKTCGEINEEDVSKEVKLAGWIHSIRNHGGIVFIDLRDQYGVTQVVVTDEQAKEIRKEMSISVTGDVLKRDSETINLNISTGQVELKAKEIEVLGPCKSNLPFEIESSTDTREDLRLKYKYLDLRNPKVKDKIFLRAEIIKFLRASMEKLSFTEVQTPILSNSSPEGARDYLVPSRKHKGMFYALPQAPQQFKQLLMASGFDRYFQIAPCFRDEDARLDRSPGEFYQLDFEMAYATQEDVFAVAEKVMTETFKRFSDKPVSEPPYVRIPFRESMLKYGSDKPDLRNPLIIIELSDFFEKVDFAPFKGSIVRGLRVPGAAKQPRSFFKSMEQFALSIGMKGLGYISVQEDMTYKGPIEKFFTDMQKNEIAGLAELKPGDVLYFISDAPDKVAGYAGQIRTEVANRLELIKDDRFEFCFITDYPMYEVNEETGKIDFTHNPFSMPQGEMQALCEKNPLDVLAWQYDIVVNGIELSSGAVRNHRTDIMVKAFEIAGYTEEDVAEKFGALFNAFQYGAPPHAGMAPGVDRIVMLIAEEENIREIIAFPLNSNAQNSMMGAPGEVSEQQLRDVHIKLR